MPEWLLGVVIGWGWLLDSGNVDALLCPWHRIKDILGVVVLDHCDLRSAVCGLVSRSDIHE